MQDRYAGDIGDFGKFGLLRAISTAGLSIGVNWYRTIPSSPELARDDGRYRIPHSLFHCDVELAETLYEISRPDNPERSIQSLEAAKLIDGAAYFSDPVPIADRSAWHREAMTKLSGCDLVFREVAREGYFTLDLAVYLNGVLHFVADERVLIGGGEIAQEYRFFVARDRPQFLCEVGGEGGEQQGEIGNAVLHEFYVLLAVLQGVVFIKSVDVFHKSRHGGVEGERLHIPVYAGNSVVPGVIEFRIQAAP